MLKFISKTVLNEDEVEGVLLLNGKTELTFYRWKDGDSWNGLTLYYGDGCVGEEVEEVDGINGWDIVDAAIDVIE